MVVKLMNVSFIHSLLEGCWISQLTSFNHGFLIHEIFT